MIKIFKPYKDSLKSQRDYSLDGIAGLLMIIIVFLHAGILESQPFSIMHFFNFFLPWFFWKAGMFHKNCKKNTPLTFAKYIKRYLVPVLFCLMTSAVVNLIRGFYPSNYSLISILRFVYCSNGVVWFLIALFAIKTLFIFLSIGKYEASLIAACSFLLSDYINLEQPAIPSIIKEIVMATFYFSCGQLMKDIQFSKWKQILGLIIVYLLYIFILPSKIEMRLEYIMYGQFEIAAIGNIMGILLINAVFKKIKDYIPHFLVYIGQESMSYYILHMQLLNISLLVLSFIFQSPVIEYMSVFITIITIPLLVKGIGKSKLNWVLGK